MNGNTSLVCFKIQTTLQNRLSRGIGLRVTSEMAGSHVLLPLIADRPGRAATHTLARRVPWRVSHRREPCTAGALVWQQRRGASLASEWGVQKPVGARAECSGLRRAGARSPVGRYRYGEPALVPVSPIGPCSSPPSFRSPAPLPSPRLLAVMDVDHEVKLLREEIMRLGAKNDKGVYRYG